MLKDLQAMEQAQSRTDQLETELANEASRNMIFNQALAAKYPRAFRESTGQNGEVYYDLRPNPEDPNNERLVLSKVVLTPAGILEIEPHQQSLEIGEQIKSLEPENLVELLKSSLGDECVRLRPTGGTLAVLDNEGRQITSAEGIRALSGSLAK